MIIGHLKQSGSLVHHTMCSFVTRGFMIDYQLCSERSSLKKRSMICQSTWCSLSGNRHCFAFKKNRFPLAVDMRKMDLAGEIRRVLNSTYLHVGRGACM